MKIKLLFLIILISTITMISLNNSNKSADAAPASTTYFDIVIDDSRQLIYGSDQYSESIDVMSIDTFNIISTINVGVEPYGIDISPDGNELAVALHGQGEIAFINLNTLSITSRIVPSGTNGLNKPYDVIYGRAGRLYSVGNSGSYGFDYVHVFDTNTKIEIGRSTEIVRSGPRLAMTADQNTLYIGEYRVSPQQLYRFDITSDIPNRTAIAPHGSVNVGTLCVLDDKVFTRGQVWSADLSTMSTFSAYGEVVCSDSLQRVFVGNQSSIIIVDTVDLTNLYEFPFPNAGSIGGVALNDAENKFYASTGDGIRVVPANLTPQAYLPIIANAGCPNFFDNFNDPTSGWIVGEDSYVRSEYLNGEYRIQTKQSGYFYIYPAPSCNRSNYTVEVDARWQGMPGNSYGLAFDITDNYSYYYLFLVNTDYREFALYLRTPSGFVTIVPSTYTSSIAWPPTASNHLKVARDGDLITLYINDRWLLGTTWSDNTVTGRNASGVVAIPYSNIPTVDVRFDNFRANNIENTRSMIPDVHASDLLKNHIYLVPDVLVR